MLGGDFFGVSQAEASGCGQRRTTCVKSGDKGFDTEIEIEIETSHSMSIDAVFHSVM
jgi:hypothetical protein